MFGAAAGACLAGSVVVAVGGVEDRAGEAGGCGGGSGEAPSGAGRGDALRLQDRQQGLARIGKHCFRLRLLLVILVTRVSAAQATVSERTARAEEAARLAAEEAAAAAQREAEEQEAARKRAQALAEEEADRRRQEELEAEQGEQRRRAEDEARRKRREEVRLQRRLENACEAQTEGRCPARRRGTRRSGSTWIAARPR